MATLPAGANELRGGNTFNRRACFAGMTLTTSDRPAPPIGSGGHPALFRRLDALMGDFMDAGNGRAAQGVVAAMWVVRGYFRDYLDLDLSDPGPPSQFGELPP